MRLSDEGFGKGLQVKSMCLQKSYSTVSNLIKFKSDNVIVEPLASGIGPTCIGYWHQTVESSTVKRGKESSGHELRGCYLKPFKHNPRLNDSGPSHVCFKLANVSATFLAVPYWLKMPHVTHTSQKKAPPPLSFFPLTRRGDGLQSADLRF